MVTDINDLKNRIRDAITAVDVDMLQPAWMEPEYYLDVVSVTDGP
jgi:hypothetical protein